MEASRYLQCLAADYGDLRDAASAAELTASVPSCPGWTVADLVRHVAQVYLHKVTLMRMAQETVIHRIDAELAAGLPVTPVPDDLAADGVDEVLKRMLAYGSATRPEDFAEMEGGHL